ncbi:MAG: hypothetical protein AAGG38_03990 [Planctomycetota bacterium]
MAQRKFHEKVETWIVVTVISALVWLYAEATVLQQKDSQTVQLLFTEPTANYALDPVEPVTVQVSFKASSGQVQQFQQTTATPLIIDLDPGDLDRVEARTVVLEEALGRAGLAEIGIANLQVEPSTYTVTLRPLREIELPVRVDTGDFKLTNGNPIAEPRTITVTAPLDVIEELRGQAISAKLADAPAPDGSGRERVATNVPLVFPDALDIRSRWISVSADTVRVNYTLANDTATTTVPNVPLYVTLPVNVQLRYTLRPTEPTDFLRDVELRGPADVIARIEAGEIAIRAELTLTDLSKLEQPSSTERPTIITPPGVTPVQLPDLMPITIRRRADTP